MCFAFQYQNHYTNLEDLQRKAAKLQLASISLLLDYNKVLREWKVDEMKYMGDFSEILSAIESRLRATQVGIFIVLMYIH